MDRNIVWHILKGLSGEPHGAAIACTAIAIGIDHPGRDAARGIHFVNDDRRPGKFFIVSGQPAGFQCVEVGARPANGDLRHFVVRCQRQSQLLQCDGSRSAGMGVFF